MSAAIREFLHPDTNRFHFSAASLPGSYGERQARSLGEGRALRSRNGHPRDCSAFMVFGERPGT
jgi:hypothetical protein